MQKSPVNVLFLCTGNSARSIMAEAILNAKGAGAFVASSAGSHPTGAVNPAAVEVLRRYGHATDGLRSKSWDEFASPDAPEFDLVITVCGNAAGETCPPRIGSPLGAHWAMQDPAAVDGNALAIRQAFEATYAVLARRIGALLELPLDAMDDEAIRQALSGIGRD